MNVKLCIHLYFTFKGLNIQNTSSIWFHAVYEGRCSKGLEEMPSGGASCLLPSSKHFSSDHIKRHMGGACSTYGDKNCTYRGFMGKPEGMRPFGRPKRGWEDHM